MRPLSFYILITSTWLLWVVGGILGLGADQTVGKRPMNAGFSIMPIIPLFPIIAILVAWVVDKVAPPWGTGVVGAFHILLATAFLGCIGYDLRRIWKNPP